MTAATHQDNDLADSKTASRIFFADLPNARPVLPSQVTETHLESVTYIYRNALGCVVGPNNLALAAPGMGSASRGLFDCLPVSVADVLEGVTGRNPGDLREALARQAGNPEHDWNSNGMYPTQELLRPVFLENGALLIIMPYDSKEQLVSRIGVNPVSVTVRGDHPWATHQVTIRSESNSRGYYLVSNSDGIGGKIRVSRQALETIYRTGDNKRQSILVSPGTNAYTGIRLQSVPPPQKSPSGSNPN